MGRSNENSSNGSRNKQQQRAAGRQQQAAEAAALHKSFSHVAPSASWSRKLAARCAPELAAETNASTALSSAASVGCRPVSVDEVVLHPNKAAGRKEETFRFKRQLVTASSAVCGVSVVVGQPSYCGVSGMSDSMTVTSPVKSSVEGALSNAMPRGAGGSQSAESFRSRADFCAVSGDCLKAAARI